MITTSDEYKELILQNGRSESIKCDVVLASGATLTFDNTNVVSAKIEDSTSEDNTFCIGEVAAQELDISLANFDGTYDNINFEGAVITCKFCLDVLGTIEEVQRGIFTVSSAEFENGLVNLVAYDNMIKFDKAYNDITTLVYPASLGEILQDLCDKCGVELHTPDFFNWNYSVPTRPTDESITGIDMISYIAEIAGCWARIDNTGGLVLGWYDLDTEDKFTLQHLSSCSVDETDVEITGVEIEPIDGDTYLYGEEGYLVTISDNPLIQELTKELTSTLGEKLVGFKFRPLSIETSCIPSIEAGDTVRVVDTKGNIYTTIVSNISFEFMGMETISADAESASERAVSNVSLSKKIKSVVDVSTKNLSDIVYEKENSGKRELSSTSTEIIRINFTANTQANPLFNAEINFVITTGGTIEFSYLIDNVSYPLKPKQTVSEGYSIIHLFLPLIGMKGNQAHSISVSMRSDDAEGYIEKSALLATVNGQGLAASTTNWDGVIELSETISTVTAKIGPSAKTVSENVSTQTQTPQQSGITEAVSACAKISISVKPITENISTESEEEAE